jgi:branched-subunit amino acid transport protein
MDQKTIFLTILGMLVVTYIPRVMPAWFLSTRKLPDAAISWLGFVPVAVLAALLIPSLVVVDQELSFAGTNIFLWASIPSILVAWKTKSFFAPVLVGMLLVAASRWIMGM